MKIFIHKTNVATIVTKLHIQKPIEKAYNRQSHLGVWHQKNLMKKPTSTEVLDRASKLMDVNHLLGAREAYEIAYKDCLLMR